MKNGKPLIGITGPNNGSIILKFFTLLAVRLAGGRPSYLRSAQNNALTHYDGFVIMGGSDIHPARYGEEALKPDSHYDLQRDGLEAAVIAHANSEKLPILGICRGMQILNITMGGTLYQEAKDVLEDFLPNESIVSKIIGRRDVRIDPQSRLYHILGHYTHYRVNSIHHQAVNKVGAGLCVVAREKNSLVQAIEQHPDSDHPFLVGVQWHPELMLHARSSLRLFQALVRTAKNVALTCNRGHCAVPTASREIEAGEDGDNEQIYGELHPAGARSVTD